MGYLFPWLPCCWAKRGQWPRSSMKGHSSGQTASPRAAVIDSPVWVPVTTTLPLAFQAYELLMCWDT